MGFLNEAGEKEYLRYKKMGILEGIDAHLINLSQGAIEVVCGDCDHQPDIYKHMSVIYQTHNRQQWPQRIRQSMNDLVATIRDAYPFKQRLCDMVSDAKRVLIQRLLGEDRRIHELKLNGGALLIASGSPVTHLGEDRVLIEHIKSAMKMKHIQTVVLFAHAPCGMAGMFNMSLKQVLENLIEAKLRLKSELVGAKVVCFVHIARANGIRRTYFISAAKWRLLNPKRVSIDPPSTAAA